MGKYEIWERRPSGEWHAVATSRTERDGIENVQRRVRSRKSFRFGNPAPTQFVVLPVGIAPHPDTIPTGTIE